MCPSDSRTTPEFQYPPAQADRSLTSLDFDTLMMKSITRRLPEQAGSSLDDSTYEMLTDSLIETSDDEAHTASIASTSDDRTPDDVSTFSDDDDDFEGHHHALDESTQSIHASTTQDDLETPMATSGDDSMMTMVPDHLENSGGSRMAIRLDEELTEDEETFLGSAVLRTFPAPQDLPKVLEVYEQPQVRIVVRAALSSQNLSAPETYRILFLGSPDKWVQDDIVAHIHAALKASSSNTRSVMVRGQMEPLGTVIDAQCCTRLQIQRSKTGPTCILSMQNGQRIWVSRRKAPQFDLAIFCHTQKSDAAMGLQIHDSLRTALRQHQIPLIELTDIKSYGAGTAEYDGQSLAICMEGRTNDETDFKLLEVLPLDAYKFCEIEPAQVNRHLAQISPVLAQPITSIAPQTRLVTLGNTIHAISKQLRTGAPAATKILLLSLALTAMLSAFLLSPVYMPLVLQKPTEMATEPSTTPVAAVLSTLVTPPAVISSSVASAPTLSSSFPPTSNGLTVVPPPANAIKQKQGKKKVENVGGFEIQTAGEKQFVLTPSKELASSRKKPQLQIQVLRDNKSIPIHSVRTISGEYFVDLEDEYPFGAFNVSVASYSKPHLRQSFEICLGHNKTWYEQTLGTTSQHIINARSALLDLSSSAVDQIQAGLHDVIGPKVSQLFQDGRRLEEAAHSAAKDGLQSGAEFIKHVPETAWTSLRKATAPVRLSQTMWKARINALRLRCNIETTAGKLMKLPQEERSRACGELQSHTHENRRA